jgi:hypothetical protein
MAGLSKDPNDVVRAAGAAAMLDPDSFATALGRRLAWERMRGRSEGLGYSVVIVVVVGWLWGLDGRVLPAVLAGAMVLAFLAGAFIGKKPR